MRLLHIFCHSIEPSVVVDQVDITNFSVPTLAHPLRDTVTSCLDSTEIACTCFIGPGSASSEIVHLVVLSHFFVDTHSSTALLMQAFILSSFLSMCVSLILSAGGSCLHKLSAIFSSSRDQPASSSALNLC